MVEKIDNFEDGKAEKLDAENEALQKIRQLKAEGDFGSRTIARELFADLHKKIFGPLREKFHKKYPDIDWDMIDREEFPKDYAGALAEGRKEFFRIISEKDEKEILERAKTLYQSCVKDGYFWQAYQIAKFF